MHATDVSPGVGRHLRAGPLVGLAAATTLLMGTVFAGTAAAQHQRGHVECGDQITFDVRLGNDLTCEGTGLVIAADNVTLDLNGHTVSGDPQARAARGEDAEDAAGIIFRRVSGSAVSNGTVTNFDTGIAIRGGSGNAVRDVVVRDNINYRILTGVNASPGDPATTADDPPPCDLGDGIAVFNSSNNVIRDNRVVNNGPFSGISLVEDSDANLVSRNLIARNNVLNQTREGAAQNAGENTVCGTAIEQGPMTRGRTVQDSGVRVEGPGADDNRVERNDIRQSGLTGIAISGYVCNPPPQRPGSDRPPPPAAPNNGGNLIFKNNVTNTGSGGLDPIADGIATLQQGPAAVVCVASGNTISHNVSSDNDRDGIFLGGRGSSENVVINNRVNDNGRDGLHVEGPSTNQAGEQTSPGAINNKLLANRGRSNERFDGFDGNLNPPCDNNMWRGNRFRTVNLACVRGPGGARGRGNGQDDGGASGQF